jgi:hypothetical protein
MVRTNRPYVMPVIGSIRTLEQLYNDTAPTRSLFKRRFRAVMDSKQHLCNG